MYRLFILLLVVLLVYKLCVPVEMYRYEVYGTLRCPYTVKMIEYLEKNRKGFVYRDIQTNAMLYKKTLDEMKTTEQGVPFVVDRKTNTHFVGYKEI